MIQAATSQPGTGDIPYQIGEIYRRRGDYGRAFAAYDQAIASNPAFAPAYLGRAQAGLAGNLIDPSAARADLENAVALDPILPEARLELARLDLDESLYLQALEQLQTAELLLPGSPWVHYLRGRVYLAQGDPLMALEEANRANQLDLTFLPVYRLTGEALQAGGQWVEAIVPLEIYLRYIEVPDAAAQIMIARSYAAAGELEKAVAAVSVALDIDPGDADVLLLRGDYYLALGQPDLAMADYRQSLRLEPNSFAAGLAVGRAHLALGAFREAYLQINPLERFAASDEQKGQLYFWRAQALEGIGEPAGAIRDWQRLLDLPEESVSAEWRQTARERISALATPTPTPRPTATP
jgi:tetratricopeptide (TPR) repeat protein